MHLTLSTSFLEHRVRAVGIAGAAAIAVLALSGCAAIEPPPRIDSADARERYEPLMDEIVETLSDAYPEIVWIPDTETSVGQGDDDACILVLPTQKGEPSLWGAADGWDSVIALIGPTLDEHGLSAPEEESLKGGWTGIVSHDDLGAEFAIREKTTTYLELSIPVTDEEC